MSEFLGRPSDTPSAKAAEAPRPTLPTDSEERKKIPVYSGFIAYFPAAIAELAKLAWFGNNKHNPGQPMHWSRDKSNDHLDCVGRHLLDVHCVDPVSNFDEAVMLAWRAMANLQLLCEKRGAPKAPGAV